MHPTSDRLLAWYACEGRDLPWRREVSAYRTLLSEAMLQQTRVETVIPYFERFVARWPTVEALAAADVQEILGAWAGLGYYRRARALHAAARLIVVQGGFPGSVEGLRALPGVGPYCAAAIGSIAFGLDALALDGNLARVGARLGAIDEPVDDRPGRDAVAALLGGLLPAGRAGDFNQALMDLGATVCLPREPRCSACPVGVECRARAKGLLADIPRRAPRKEPRTVRVVALVARRGEAVLLVQRPEGGLLGGLWAPPHLELREHEEPEAGLVRLLDGRSGEEPRPLGRLVHVFTHRRWEVEVFAVALAHDGTPRDETERLAIPGSAGGPPLSRLAERILAQESSQGASASRSQARQDSSDASSRPSRVTMARQGPSGSVRG